LRLTVGSALVIAIWIQLSMGICKSKKKLKGKVRTF
jgi:hypothetical protein